jgi:hypothetical protein
MVFFPRNAYEQIADLGAILDLIEKGTGFIGPVLPSRTTAGLMVDQVLLWRHPRLPAEGIMILDLAQNFQHIPAFFRELRRYLDKPSATGHTRAQNVFSPLTNYKNG